MTDSGVWFGRAAWPLHRNEAYPYSTTSEGGHTLTVDRANGDDLCEATCITLHGLDLERRQTFCMMPKGHDTPHMPQDEGNVKSEGRLIIRRFADA